MTGIPDPKEHPMKRLDSLRAAFVVAGLGAAPAALADPGATISPAGWASLLAIPVVVAVLWFVHKRIG
jgi:hypothetical protein